MNPPPLEAGGEGRRRPGEADRRFMVPMRAQKSVAATHELVWSPGFSRSRPPEGAQPAKAGTPNTARFMVTIHARKRLQAFHEPPVRCPPLRAPETQGRAKAWTPNSAVPVHGRNAR